MAETQQPNRRALADPGALSPFKPKPRGSTSGTAQPGEELLQVVVETPKGSRQKYGYDEEDRIFRLKSVLPAGMVFPFDFGFLPSTVGGDGDPLDVLVLSDEPTFPGCVLLARLLGVMEVEQTESGETSRNDRLLAVSETSQLFSRLHTIDHVPETLRNELDAFFETYHRLQNKHSRLLTWKGPDPARKLIEEGISRAQAPNPQP